MSNMLLKGLLNHLPAGLYIQCVDFRIHVFNNIQLLLTVLENQFDFLLVLDVARIDDRNLQSHAADHLGIVQCGIPLAVIHAARDKNQIRLNFPDLLQVGPAKPSAGHIMNDSARTQRRFLRSLGCHIINQSVHGHLQSAGRGRSRQHLSVFNAAYSFVLTKVVDSALKSDPHISVEYRSRCLTLPPEARMIGIQIRECVDHCRCGSDFRYQYVYIHLFLSSNVLMICRFPADSSVCLLFACSVKALL